MAENKQKKNQRISKDQKEKLVDYMSTNLEFARGQFGGPNGNIENHSNWEELSIVLNAMGGSSKTTDQWKKCWIDLKAAVRKQLNAKRHFLNKTGGGSSKDAPRDLNSFEEQILFIMGVDAVDGDVVTPESGVLHNCKDSLQIEMEYDDMSPSPSKRKKNESTAMDDDHQEERSLPSSSYKKSLTEAKEMHQIMLSRIGGIEEQNAIIINKLNIIMDAFGLDANNI